MCKAREMLEASQCFENLPDQSTPQTPMRIAFSPWMARMYLTCSAKLHGVGRRPIVGRKSARHGSITDPSRAAAGGRPAGAAGARERTVRMTVSKLFVKSSLENCEPGCHSLAAARKHIQHEEAALLACRTSINSAAVPPLSGCACKSIARNC